MNRFPKVIEAPPGDRDLTAWAEHRTESLRSTLLETGAILFRGFGPGSIESFGQFANIFIDDDFDYTFALTPRTRISGKVVTSTEYPADLTLPLHSECSAHRDWPMILMFYCRTPPTTGGETPIADNRRVYQALASDLRSRFEEAGILYVRKIVDDRELEAIFGTADRAAIREFCGANDYRLSEGAGSSYDLRWRAPAVVAHPETGEAVWFNHLQSFQMRTARHLSGRGSPAGSSDLSPWEACYGDGTPIENRAMHEIRRAYRSEMAAFKWASGDILMIDNMLTSHARNPFTGPRDVLLAMGDSYRSRTRRTI